MFDYFLCKTRNKAFNMLDMLKGSIIQSAYDEIKKIDNMNSDDNYVQNYQREAFMELANHAIKTTEYYASYNSYELSDFPVVNKDVIRNNQNMFLSKRFDKAKLVKMSTSGSTGTPFICYQDIAKKRRVNAEVIYYSEKAGYSVGRNLIFMRAVTEKSHKSKFQQWIQNETLIDISKLDVKAIEIILDKVYNASKKGSMILAYASTYDALRDYFISYGDVMCAKANITGIVSSSEMLFDNTRAAMKKAFKCPVYSRYSNQENGIIGQDEEENNVFLINEASYIVEVLDMEKDVSCCEGQVGRIVVTDLFNYAMPMIRYDTGDIGSIISISSNGRIKKAINNFGGRKVDVVYDSLGNRLSPHIITNNFWNFPEINQYQFIQENNDTYTIKVNYIGEFNRQETLRQMLHSLLGHDSVINIKRVDEIPVMASGKRKYIVNKMLNK